MIKRSLRKIGIEVVKDRGIRVTMDQALKHLKTLGFDPNTVIDVGVAYGTPELYENFPNSKIILIEPLNEFSMYINKITKKYNATHINKAAGCKEGQIEINVKPQITSSSTLKGKILGINRKVPLSTIDNICAKEYFNGPYLIKVDVEGAEVDVLKGAKKILEETDVVILEVTFFIELQNAPEFFEVLTFMDSIGFVLYDIFNLRNREKDNILSQADITFVRKEGYFRNL